MAEEQKNPEEEQQTTEPQSAEIQAEQISQSEADENVAVTPGYQPNGEAEKLPGAETAFEESVATAIDRTAAASESPAVQAWDQAVTGAMEQADAVIANPRAGETPQLHTHEYSDTTTVPLLGEITVYGGVYTVVFVVLGIFTILEVLSAEIIPPGFVQIALLLAAAVAKAVLVILFYMHLRDENPLYRVVLLLPLFIALISVLFLLGAPTGAGFGYN